MDKVWQVVLSRQKGTQLQLTAPSQIFEIGGPVVFCITDLVVVSSVPSFQVDVFNRNLDAEDPEDLYRVIGPITATNGVATFREPRGVIYISDEGAPSTPDRRIYLRIQGDPGEYELRLAGYYSTV